MQQHYAAFADLREAAKAVRAGHGAIADPNLAWALGSWLDSAADDAAMIGFDRFALRTAQVILGKVPPFEPTAEVAG